MITKWEQLNLAPELLRSLSTFGCVVCLCSSMPRANPFLFGNLAWALQTRSSNVHCHSFCGEPTSLHKLPRPKNASRPM